MFNTSVDSIVRVLAKGAAKLRALKEKKTAEGMRCEDEMRRMSDKADALYDEADRAERIADRIDELLS